MVGGPEGQGLVSGSPYDVSGLLGMTRLCPNIRMHLAVGLCRTSICDSVISDWHQAMGEIVGVMA